jgi:peroxiredoxin
LEALQGNYQKVKDLGAEMIAISPQTLEHSASTVEKLKLSFPVLSDQGGALAEECKLKFDFNDAMIKAYLTFDVDLRKYNGVDAWFLPVPATYIVKDGGEIVSAFVDSDYTKRMEPGDMMDAVKEAAA